MSHNFAKARVGKGRPVRAELWRNDVTISYEANEPDERGRGERGEIEKLTKGSLQRFKFVAHNTPVVFTHMSTLTYPSEYDTDGKVIKGHLRRWLDWATRTCEIDSYLWALEFQRRGAPHFHVFTCGGVLGQSKQACSNKWFDIVNSDDGRHLLAGTRVERLRRPDAAGRYATKYATKPYQKVVPPAYRNVGRWWGHSYDVKPEPIAARPLSGWGDLIQQFDGWDYQDRLLNRQPTKVLYNAGLWLQNEIENGNNIQIQE